jgi:hypothetical protein
MKDDEKDDQAEAERLQDFVDRLDRKLGKVDIERRLRRLQDRVAEMEEKVTALEVFADELDREEPFDGTESDAIN